VLHRESITDHLLSVRPQWKQEMRSLLPVKENNFIKLFWYFEEKCLSSNKHTLVLKVLTDMKKIGVAETFSRCLAEGATC